MFYTLSKPAWIRIRLLSRKDPRLVLRTLVNWEARDLGENGEKWNGLDASGWPIDPRRCPGLFVIEGESPTHTGHDWNRCGDPRLRIRKTGKTASGGGRQAVRVDIRGRKHGYFEEMGGALRLVHRPGFC